MLERCFAQFFPVLKQNARIIAVKIIGNKSNGHFMFEFGNSLDLSDLCCILLRVQQEIR